MLFGIEGVEADADGKKPRLLQGTCALFRQTRAGGVEHEAGPVVERGRYLFEVFPQERLAA